MKGDETTCTEWESAHTELLRLSCERTRLDVDEGHWLLRALRTGAHQKLGYASFAEYIERLFGYSPRWTREKLRVAEALETLPVLSQALAEGEFSWSIARELTRVATTENEADWLASSRGRTARDVERLVSGRAQGSHPNDPVDPAAKRHALRFEVSAMVFAAFREALAKLRRDAEGPLDDDAALLLMARQILGGPSNTGVSSYQMALTVCERCRNATVQGRGERVNVERDIVEMATCDAQTVTMSTDEDTHVGHANARAKQSIPPATRRLVHHRDGGRCRVPGCRHAVFVDVHHIEAKADGGSHDPENLVTLCSAHHRALHRGELVVEGRASAPMFRHADGSEYGARHTSPHSVDARATAFRALRSLGFRENEARRALARVDAHVGPESSAEAVLRRALAMLTEGSHPRSRIAAGPKAA